MRFDIYLFFGQCLILYNQYTYITAKAIRGPNIQQATQEEFTFIASLMKRRPNNRSAEKYHFCTGSLVSKQNILTGAHCLDGESLSSFQVVLGDISLRGNIKYYPLWWMSYNEWSILMSKPTKYETNDLALIRLTEEVFSNITPGIISSRQTRNLYGLNATTGGWGETDTELNPIMLKKTSLKILSNAECNEIVTRVEGETLKIHERLLCTVGDPYAVLSFGDSGGPLLCENEIVGVNYGTCPFPELQFHPQKVNIHFSIDYYKDFIIAMNR